MLTIDGSLGEGGGQILRSALALSVCLRRPFRIVNIRARRPKPGLRPQPALLAASAASDLRLEGGTHNPRAPTFECLARGYLPLIRRMGPRIAIELERAGFEPAGGGVV